MVVLELLFSRVTLLGIYHTGHWIQLTPRLPNRLIRFSDFHIMETVYTVFIESQALLSVPTFGGVEFTPIVFIGRFVPILLVVVLFLCLILALELVRAFFVGFTHNLFR